MQKRVACQALTREGGERTTLKFAKQNKEIEKGFVHWKNVKLCITNAGDKREFVTKQAFSD